MLIDTSYFVGSIRIPNLDQAPVAALVTQFIMEREIELLRICMGEDMYRDAMNAWGLQGTVFTNITNGNANVGMPADWANLLNGVEYVGLDERKHKWHGFLSIQDDYSTIKQSPIANYVYYWFMRDGVTISTGVGEVFMTPENGRNVGPGAKMTRAWNQMVDWLHEFIWYMDTYYQDSDYVDWWLQNRYRMLEKFRYINTFSI